MDIIRKTLKAYIAAMAFFVALTFALAALIAFTPFRESWAFPGLIVIMSMAAALLGFMEGAAVGRRGLVTGAAASVLLVALIIGAAGAAFSGSFGAGDMNIFYLIPVAAGAAGGSLGTNIDRE